MDANPLVSVDTKTANKLAWNGSWTSGQVASLILLLVICAVLVWNAYHPQDIYLGDLSFETLVGDKYEPRKDTSVLGKTLQIHTTYYPKGVGTHANSEIHTRFIPEGYSFFAAEIGVDAEVGPNSPASVIFSVYAGGADGTLLYESPVLRAGMPPRLVYVPVRGRRSLTLVVRDAGDGNEADHADWAMARFIAR